MYLSADDATGYSQWLITNFLAVPALTLLGMMLAGLVGAAVIVLRERQSAMYRGRLYSFAALVAVAVFGAACFAEDVSWPHLLTIGNAVKILVPTTFVGLLLAHVAKRCESSA